MDIVATFVQFGLSFAAGWGVILFLLWIRPEYLFLLFYTFANLLLIFVFRDVWVLTWADAPLYALDMAVAAAMFLAIGAPIVTLFKWFKKPRNDKKLDEEMARIRAEIAARESQQ